MWVEGDPEGSPLKISYGFPSEDGDPFAPLWKRIADRLTIEDIKPDRENAAGA